MEKESQCMLKRKHDFLEDFDDFFNSRIQESVTIERTFNAIQCHELFKNKQETGEII